MNYVQSLNLFGVEAKEIPCITKSGAPTTTTVGVVGLLYMDTDNGDVYKCTAVNDNVYTWESMHSGGNVDLTGVVKSVNGKTPDENGDVEITVSGSGGSLNIRDMEENEIFIIAGSNPDEPGEDEPSTGAVAINGRIIDIDMRNVLATDEYLTDTSGNGNHMRLSTIGSSSKDNVWTPNYYDTTANITKYVGAYTENTIDFSGDFTIEVFCEVTGNTNNSFFATGAPGWSGKDYMFEIKARNDNGVATPICVGFADQKKGYYPKIEDLSEIFLPGNFYHITVARTGNDVSLYKNGVLVSTLALESAIPLNYRCYLSGGIASDGTVNASNGPVPYKMLRAYTRALSASEIANHYSIELAKG